MTDKYQWPRFIAPIVKNKIKGEIESHIRRNVNGPGCGPFSIRIDTYAFDSCFKAHIQCQCNNEDHAFLLKGKIPI